MAKQLTLEMGAMSDALGLQIDKQGFKFNPDVISRHQRLADAIVDLSIAGLITQASVDKSRNKLFKLVADHLRKTEIGK